MERLNTVRRSRFEIYFDVLKVIDRGTAKPTRIMYDTNTSWEVLGSTFDILIKSDFVREEKENDSLRYYITEKGRNALSYHVKSLEGFTRALDNSTHVNERG